MSLDSRYSSQAEDLRELHEQTRPVALQSRPIGETRQPLAISVGVVILAAITLVCVGLLAVPFWTALVPG